MKGRGNGPRTEQSPAELHSYTVKHVMSVHGISAVAVQVQECTHL